MQLKETLTNRKNRSKIFDFLELLVANGVICYCF